MSRILLDILIPKIKFGPLSVSAARMPLGGVTLAHIFEPMQAQPPRDLTEGDNAWEVFRIGLEEGQGLDVPLPIGRLGFFNDAGVLVVTVPQVIAQSILGGWAQYQQDELAVNGGSTVGRYIVRRGLRGSLNVLGRTIEIRAPE